MLRGERFFVFGRCPQVPRTQTRSRRAAWRLQQCAFAVACGCTRAHAPPPTAVSGARAPTNGTPISHHHSNRFFLTFTIDSWGASGCCWLARACKARTKSCSLAAVLLLLMPARNARGPRVLLSAIKPMKGGCLQSLWFEITFERGERARKVASSAVRGRATKSLCASGSFFVWDFPLPLQCSHP